VCVHFAWWAIVLAAAMVGFSLRDAILAPRRAGKLRERLGTERLGNALADKRRRYRFAMWSAALGCVVAAIGVIVGGVTKTWSAMELLATAFAVSLLLQGIAAFIHWRRLAPS
jgi:hypothetical protein